MYNQIVSVSKKVQNEQGENVQQVVGEVNIPTPTLDEFFPDFDFGEVKVNEDGSVTYVSNAFNYLMKCVEQQVRTTGKGRLQAQSVALKEGSKIDQTLVEIITPSTSEGKGEALKVYKEFIKLFKAWVTENVSEKAVKIFIPLVTNKSGISMANQVVKEKLGERLEEFAASLNEGDQGTYENAILSVIEACGEDEVNLDEFEL